MLKIECSRVVYRLTSPQLMDLWHTYILPAGNSTISVRELKDRVIESDVFYTLLDLARVGQYKCEELLAFSSMLGVLVTTYPFLDKTSITVSYEGNDESSSTVING